MAFRERALVALAAVLPRVPVPGRCAVADRVGRFLTPPSGMVRGRIGTMEAEFAFGDQIQRQMYFGLFDPPLTRFIAARLKPGMVFYDLGANIGYFAVLAAGLVGPGGEVHAFEPVPDNAARIRRNLDLNGVNHGTVKEVGVSDSAAGFTLYVGDAVGQSGWASVVPSPRRPRAIEVSTQTLDAYVLDGERRRPDLIKMDIEGAEPRALAGMRRLIGGEHAPDLIVEVNRFLLDRGGGGVGAVLDPLRAAGYTLRRVTLAGTGAMPADDAFTGLIDVYATKRASDQAT